MDAEDQRCVARCHAVLSALGKCISMHKDRIWTVEYRECGYRGTDIVRRYAIRAGGYPCRDIWKSAGKKIYQAGEGLRRQDSVACDAADSHAIPVLLYRTSHIQAESKASIIEAVNVFVAIIVSGFIFHQENVTAKKMLGCLVGFAGVVLINMNGMNFHMSLSGEGAIFLSTVAYAFSSVFLKRYSAKHNPVMLSGYQFIVGGIILSAAGFAMGGRLSTVSTEGVLMLIYLALVSAVAYSLWGMLLKYNPISRVAVFGFMNPVFGVILSAWLLREGAQALGPISLVSLVLVCAGIYIVNK